MSRLISLLVLVVASANLILAQKWMDVFYSEEAKNMSPEDLTEIVKKNAAETDEIRRLCTTKYPDWCLNMHIFKDFKDSLSMQNGGENLESLMKYIDHCEKDVSKFCESKEFHNNLENWLSGKSNYPYPGGLNVYSDLEILRKFGKRSEERINELEKQIIEFVPKDVRERHENDERYTIDKAGYDGGYLAHMIAKHWNEQKDTNEHKIEDSTSSSPAESL